ncbi:catalase [Punctularia strigosozonata HHB-11173 SS5]|uniref:catalase n=1 Tax=Punctularia strigosozonata (strain HHB-11173) TaxID=741275 RepID=UPI00044184D2|nr:catalase [Punctularia strigosozonata HHB-11173 SS5]EIN13642.1 catalase [Punctularia strigosozonata HHB-11173 SS5]
MASTVKQAVQELVTGVTSSKKIADLQKNIQDPTTGDSVQRTDHGVKIKDPDNWLKVQDGSTTGPSLLEDQIAREKIMRFDHERIPERVVHARGAGAHGYFKVYDDRASKYTYAPVLTDSSRTTPTFVRFSTVQGSRGSADTVRDVRGFATKFYTEEGNWDIVGNNIPVFFIQDAIKFPDFVHAVKPEPHNEVPQGQSAHNNFWDFVGLQPEATHMVMWAMSDRAIPRSYRMMQGFGVNTYTLLNAKGERFFVKFHWIPELGVHSFVWDEALKVCGQDPDFHRKDLEEAIRSGAFPKWFFGLQVIPEAKEHDFDFDILDATKIWPEELVPVEIVGEMVLNRCVDEYFPETEQVAFCTSHVVPGIGFSDDPLLQGRNFSYFDTQISRLGVNWQELPINRPVCPVMNINRDGAMRHTINRGQVNYYPNRHQMYNPSSAEQSGYHEHATKIVGIKQRVRGAKFQEHYNQAQMFYNSMAPHEKAHMIAAFSFELAHCDDPVVYETYTKLLNNVDFELAKAVATKVGGVVPEKPLRPNPGHKTKVSQTTFVPEKPTVAGRRIAILVADGFNLAEVQGIRALIKSCMANSYVIGPRRGKIQAAGGGSLQADHHFEDQRSTLFDALIIPSGEHVQKLAELGRAVHWVREAFGHCKAIGAIGEGVLFLRDAVQLPSVKLAQSLSSDAVTTSYGVVTTGKYDTSSAATDSVKIGPSETGFVANFIYQVSLHRCYERELDGLTDKVAY